MYLMALPAPLGIVLQYGAHSKWLNLFGPARQRHNQPGEADQHLPWLDEIIGFHAIELFRFV